MRKQTLLFLMVLFLCAGATHAQNFVTKWRFATATTQIDIFAETAGVVNYTWSHGASTGSGSFNTGVFGTATISGINLPANTELTLNIQPTNFRRFFIRNSASRIGLIDVSQWGAVPWSTMQAAFAGAPNLNISATDVPNLSNVTNMTEMFAASTSLNGPVNIGSWNTATVTSMGSMFSGATAFNQPINSWNVSNVTDMQSMFYQAIAFNQPLSAWDVSKVTNMFSMFYGTNTFNQPLSSWNTGNVTDMGYMFHQAIAFNQPIGNWNVTKVTNRSNMVTGATVFNQNLGAWVIHPNVSVFEFTGTAMSCENYSLSLKGWAENNPTVTNRTIGGGNRSYGPAAVPYRNQLISQGWSIFNDIYDASCSVVLPVVFGDITATVQNRTLRVNWATLSETNNDVFDIEVSADGTDFISIGQLKTQAKDGNSSASLQYSFTKEASEVPGLLGFSVVALAVSGFAAARRKKITKTLLAGCVLLGTVIACNKNGDTVTSDATADLYVRIKQVDKDGGFKYSKVVKVVKR